MATTNYLTFEYPPLRSELSGGWLRVLRIFGPGAIIASVTVGTGETIFAPRAGATFGYSLFWVVLVAVLCKGVLVYTGARHLVLTGEHPVQAWARFPGPSKWVPILMGLLVVLAFPLWIAALADAVGSLCAWVTGIGGSTRWGRPLWGTGIILAAMLLSLVQTYNIIERVSTVILLLKIVFILAAVLIVKPNWVAALGGVIVPHLPKYEPWVSAGYPDVASRTLWLEIGVLLGAVGGGVQDYTGYVGMMREKEWGASGAEAGWSGRLPLDPLQIGLGRRWLRAPLLDVVVSFGSVFVITGCFMLLGAAVLHPLHLIPTNADLYSKQSFFLALVHPGLVSVYKAGIFAAIFGAIYGCFEVYTRSAYEPLRAIWPQHRWSLKRVRLWVTMYAGVGGLLLLCVGLRTVTLASIVSPFSGVLGCGLWCLAMVFVDRRQMPKPYQMSRRLLALTLTAGVAMSVIGIYVMVRGA
ncbi:MAG TPA: Nramp family divalent metal transporter [Pyrinomonadaceae bacterium]